MSGEHTIGHIGLDLFLLAPPPAGSQPTLGERGGFAEEPASFACRSMPFLSFLNQLRSRPECDGVKTMPSMGWSDFYKCFWKFGRSVRFYLQWRWRFWSTWVCNPSVRRRWGHCRGFSKSRNSGQVSYASHLPGKIWFGFSLQPKIADQSECS
jgi:hypothetical protein